MYKLICAADLALTHGAIVDINGKIWYAYTGRTGLAVKSEGLYDLALELYYNTPHGAILVIDWCRHSGSWGNKGRGSVTAMLMTQLISFYAAICTYDNDNVVHFIEPALVRYCVGLPANTNKFDVHHHCAKLFPKDLPDDISGDNRDAWLLAYTLQCSIERTKETEL